MESRDNFKEYVFKYFGPKTILESDDLTVVIRGHLLIENILEKILSTKLNIKVFEEKDLTFDLKLKMAHSMNLLVNLYPAIKRLNKIRNVFAHKLETKLEDQDITIFVELLESNGYSNNVGWQETVGNKKLRLGFALHFILGFLSAMYEANSKQDK